MNPDYTLPNMFTPVIVSDNYTFPQQSFGFIVIPDVNALSCDKKKWIITMLVVQDGRANQQYIIQEYL